jgi:hypothetical protein
MNIIDSLGDWNPQFLRELKGRLHPRNLIVTGIISLLGQFVLLLFFQTQLINQDIVTTITNQYCTGAKKDYYAIPTCLQDGSGNLIVNWQSWWLDIFIWLSIIGSFSLLVAGTYLVINNLATEERQDTLNFIRLTPQSPQTILLGKILGVPILVYLGVALAIPLHLWSGLSASIPLWKIFCFWAIVVATCLLYFSAALLFGLTANFLGGFQSWLGSGTVLGFLILTQQIKFTNESSEYGIVALGLLNPFYLIPHLSESSFPSFLGYSFATISLGNFHWFGIPLGASFVTLVGFCLVNYLIITKLIWQGLERCYLDPSVTILSKKHSYLLATYFQLVTLGCATWQKLLFENNRDRYLLSLNLGTLMFFDFFLFMYLIAAISPHRPMLYDWARYQHIYNRKRLGEKSNLFKDMMWGEKSPALLAMAVNVIITISLLGGFVLISDNSFDSKIKCFLSLGFGGCLAMFYAAIAQLMLLMKNKQRVFWAIGSILAAMVVPITILAILCPQIQEHTFLWSFSIIAPVIVLPGFTSYPSSVGEITFFTAIFCHFVIVGLLSLRLRYLLIKAGESATKAVKV